jgi:hypothetical protein
VAIVYCCSVMEGLLSWTGQRGFSVAVTEDNVFHSGLVFVLEARAIAAQDLESASISASCPIVLAVHVVIKCCPSCGVPLKRHYDQFRGELTIVAGLLKSLGIASA